MFTTEFLEFGREWAKKYSSLGVFIDCTGRWHKYFVHSRVDIKNASVVCVYQVERILSQYNLNTHVSGGSNVSWISPSNKVSISCQCSLLIHSTIIYHSSSSIARFRPEKKKKHFRDFKRVVSFCRCMCSSGYTGQNCENEYIPCDPSPCKNGGTCHQIDGLDYECICPEGEFSNCFSFVGLHISRSQSVYKFPTPRRLIEWFDSLHLSSTNFVSFPLVLDPRRGGSGCFSRNWKGSTAPTRRIAWNANVSRKNIQKRNFSACAAKMAPPFLDEATFHVPRSTLFTAPLRNLVPGSGKRTRGIKKRVGGAVVISRCNRYDT